MLKKILIFGAGSIGAHHINAGRSLGCDVYFTDINFEQAIYLKNNFNKIININETDEDIIKLIIFSLF